MAQTAHGARARAARLQLFLREPGPDHQRHGHDDPEGRLRIGAKDISLACALAEEFGVEASLYKYADAMFQDAMAMGLGDADLAALARAVEARTGASIVQS